MSSAYRLTPLPNVFHSCETDQPFTHCLDCERYLLGGETDYLIEKAVRTFPEYDTREAVFEYAMCLDCYETLWQSFSEASREHVEAYFMEHVNVAERTHRFLEADGDELSAWIGRCMVKGTRRDALEEYQLVGHARGDQLVLSHFPYLVSGAAMSEVSALLSNETRDELGGFMDEFFGLPPELRKTPGDPVPVAV